MVQWGMNMDDSPPAIVVVAEPIDFFEVLSPEQDCSSNELLHIVESVSSSVDVTEMLWEGEVHNFLSLGGVWPGWQSVHVDETKII